MLNLIELVKKHGGKVRKPWGMFTLRIEMTEPQLRALIKEVREERFSKRGIREAKRYGIIMFGDGRGTHDHQLEAFRNEVIEECEKVCEQLHEDHGDDAHIYNAAVDNCAEAIRQMKQ